MFRPSSAGGWARVRNGGLAPSLRPGRRDLATRVLATKKPERCCEVPLSTISGTSPRSEGSAANAEEFSLFLGLADGHWPDPSGDGTARRTSDRPSQGCRGRLRHLFPTQPVRGGF